MKKTASWLILGFCLLALTSCHSAERRAGDVAEQFLKAYYSADYAKAATLATPAFSGHLSKGAALQDRLPDEIAQKMKEAVAQTSFKIVSVKADKEAGTAVVYYELSAPTLDGPMPKQLLLKLEGRSAAVDGIE